MPLSLPTLTAKDSAEDMAAALDEAGCLVVEDVFDVTERDAVVAELRPFMDAADPDLVDPEAFYPPRTRRITALAARSDAVGRMIVDPTIEAVCDRFLLPNAEFGYQVHVTAALEVGPGARDQALHREEDLYPYFELPRPNLILASMWAISDFTADNGGTQIVLGSHTWPAGRTAEPHEILRAEMPAGSVLFWAGGTLHGAGANVTDDEWRYGMILTYNLSFLRQEENQHVSMPLADALALPADVQARLGFAQDNGDGLGFYDPRPVLQR